MDKKLKKLLIKTTLYLMQLDEVLDVDNTSDLYKHIENLQESLGVKDLKDWYAKQSKLESMLKELTCAGAYGHGVCGSVKIAYQDEAGRNLCEECAITQNEEEQGSMHSEDILTKFGYKAK